ncbi:MAG: SapC family protein [Pseudomonadales bacterium]
MTTPQPRNPLFYDQPAVLSRVDHADLKVVARSDFTFARNSPSVPLAISEFAVASAHYPIAFVHADEPGSLPMPVAVLALSSESNRFVDEAGNWRAGSYIPAYVRRYPFAFATDEQGTNLILCADMASDRLSTTEGVPLFSDGEPSEATSRMLTFCTSYQRDHEATRRFVEVLREMSLLKEQRLNIRNGDTPVKIVEGLSLLDRGRFRALDNDRFLRLRSLGYLGPIYAHLASLHRLRDLAL